MSRESCILVCFALKEEAFAFRKRVARKSEASILVTGIGRKNAEKAVEEFLATRSAQQVLTCGFAGGLNPALAAGAVVFSTDDAALREKLLAVGARPTTFFCASKIAWTASEKQELGRTTGADAVEMESEVIQAMCRARAIPCATVRVISDTANEDLPLDFNKFAKPDLSLDYMKLALAVAKSPKKIGTLLRLQKRCQFASARLAEVLIKVIWPE